MSEPPRPCLGCPVRGLPCPSTDDPRYCSLVGRDPDRYRPIILWRARARAGAVQRLPPPWAFGDDVRAALRVDDPGADGGRWLAALIRHSDPARVAWTGMVLGDRELDGGLVRELANLLPLHAGPGPAKEHREPENLVRSHPDEAAALREACLGAEVLVTAGRSGPPSGSLGLPIVQVATEGATNRGLAGQLGDADRLVALTPSAAMSFPAGCQMDVILLPAGVEIERCTPRVGRARQRAAWGRDDSWTLVGLSPRNWSASGLRVAGLAAAALGDTCLVLLDDEPSGGPREGLGVPSIASPAGAHPGDVLAALDVFLAPGGTWPGDQPSGLFEAWMAGVPVAIPPPESKPGDLTPGDLTLALVAALSDDGRRAAERDRRRAWERLTAAAMAERWASLLAEVARPGHVRFPPLPLGAFS